MNRPLAFLIAVCISAASVMTRADVVTDWNAVLCNTMQTDGILNTPDLANPGWATRTMAMMNGAIYDAFQSVNRTHTPFMYNALTPGASRDAAAAQAAYEIILECYPLRHDLLDPALANTLSQVPDGAAKTSGIALGHAIAQQYMAARQNDGANSSSQYMPSTDPGKWRPDPFHPTQEAWGPEYGAVPTFAVRDGSAQANAHDLINALPSPPDLNSPAYTAAYDQVINYGALSTYGPGNTLTSRTPAQTSLALFWAYDRASMGPPPVLFLRNVEQIATAVGNSPEQNARLFAMASVSMADAAIAAWDAKFQQNFWRPVTAIQEANTDNNPNTIQDSDWKPLGAPGADPNSSADDFTPPFPSWTSGHATMGGAVFKALELFYGTNDFAVADASVGNDPVTAEYMLTSQEPGSGGAGSPSGARMFHSFTQTGVLDIGTENSPEGENGTSRIFLGIHWIFDQRDGITLGNSVASYVFNHDFAAVPEPTSLALILLTSVMITPFVWRSRRPASAA